MSEERFDRLDKEITDLRARTDQRFDAVDRRLEAVDQRFEGVDRRFEAVDRRFEAVDRRFDAVDRRFDAVDKRIDDLDRHMHVLHEDLKADIAALPHYSGPTRAEFAELKDLMVLRLDTLEDAVRQHSKDISELRRRRR